MLAAVIGNRVFVTLSSESYGSGFRSEICTYEEGLILVQSSWVHSVDAKMKRALILSNSNMITLGSLCQLLAGCSVELKSLPLDEVMKKHSLPGLEWYSALRAAMRAYNKAEREGSRIGELIEMNRRELDGLMCED